MMPGIQPRRVYSEAPLRNSRACLYSVLLR
jgi:hypothetical protein